MCGIAGYVGTREVPQSRLDSCLALMGRRGPDARDVHTERRGDRVVHLLHSRLSILDLDHRSDQPYAVADHRLVYNGELYNFVELRDRMREAGHPFTTTGDTEVLARAVAADGTGALDAFEGMWAFADYDVITGELLLSRDRFGEKPLYIMQADDGLYFASEPKMIAALRGQPLHPNRTQIRRYLVNGYKALYRHTRTFHEGLHEVLPGTSLRVGADGSLAEERYWTPAFEPDDSLSFDDCVDLAREALLEAVRIRLRADVPLAFCMSGGVDSNTLISIAKRVHDYDVHGFTIVNSDARYEEQDLVEDAVRQLGIRHTNIPVDPSGFMDNMRELVRQHDAPVYTMSYYAQWLLLKEVAAAGYRVSIMGTSADELFTGYYDHHLLYMATIQSDEGLLRTRINEWEAHVKPWVRNPHLQDPERFIRDPQFRDHITLGSDQFSSWLVEPFTEAWAEDAWTDDLLRMRMMNELFTEATPVILHEDDANAMYYSIENRSPFLDRRLFDTTMRFPTRHLIKDGYAKAVLRTSMRGIVPDPILDSHRKVGFNAPIMDFLDLDDDRTRKELLADSPIWDVVRRDAIESLIGKGDLPNSESKFLFSFIGSKMFLEEAQ